MHARQSPAAWKVAPPGEEVPTGHCTPAGEAAPGQYKPAPQGTPVVDVVPEGQYRPAAVGVQACSARPPPPATAESRRLPAAASAAPTPGRSTSPKRRPPPDASGAKPSTATRRLPSPRLDRRACPVAPASRATG